MYIYTHTFIRTCIKAYTHTHKHNNTYIVYIYIYIYIYIYTYIYSNMNTHSHTYIHTKMTSFNRIPKNELAQQVRDQSIAKWQIQWDHTTKWSTTKHFFPIIKERLTTKIKLTPNFTAIVTDHGKTKAYLHRFKIIDSPECPCDGGNPAVGHLLYDCTKLQREREKLISNI